ncbi:MAG TPA: nucleotidyltransferase domain-containing protein [Sedimentisphaerales bacterium]|nr:nucleotidyltransferase domain-containing protein [Sedimentisphaerales bacterium]
MKTLSSLQNNSADIELLRRCKTAVTDVAGDAELVLYGSRARGDAKEHSDYDILVVVDGPVDMALKERILANVYPLLLETGRMLTLIIYSKQQWDSPLYRAMPLHKNVDREGLLI